MKLLGHRQGKRAETRKGGLEVGRRGIVDSSADASGGKMLPQCIASGTADDEQVPDMGRLFLGSRGQHDIRMADVL